MKELARPTFEILTPIDRREVLKHIERCARTCYQSFARTSEGSAERLVKHIVERHHESCLEHFSVSVRLIVDRAIQNELVRHRLCSFSVESTRYCKYDEDLVVIRPVELFGGAELAFWHRGVEDAERAYHALLKQGCKPENARSVLPLCLKTEMVMTANLREWKHVFDMRCSPAAHPDVRYVMCALRDEFARILPEVFENEHCPSYNNKEN